MDTPGKSLDEIIASAEALGQKVIELMAKDPEERLVIRQHLEELRFGIKVMELKLRLNRRL